MTIVEQAGRGHLLRILGVGFGVAVAIGGMIGSGILRTPNLMALDVPSIPIILGLWLLGAIDAALGVNVFAEMAAAIPSAGGAYDYARRTFGDVLGLIVGWSNWLACLAGIAAAAISFSNFLPLIWPATASHTTGVSLGILFALFGANLLGLREGRALQESTSFIKAIMLVAFCIAAALFTPAVQVPTHASMAHALGLAGIVGAYQLVRGAYAGWESPVYFGEETVNPGLVIPRAMLAGLVFTSLLYLCVNAALLYALGLDGTAASPLPFTAVLAYLGSAAGPLFALTAMITVASCANSNIMSAPRIMYAMAEHGLLPSAFSWVSKGGSPYVALGLTALVAIGLALSGAFEIVFGLIGTMIGVMGIVVTAALFAARRREPGLARPFMAIGYPYLPALWLILQLVLLLLFSISDVRGILFAVGLSLACIPLALIARRGKAARDRQPNP
ncbi:MAG TPA: APC family permease [Rhizomicrobium sp.]|nr:APC family permease [Rhizomicrobium sp.]